MPFDPTKPFEVVRDAPGGFDPSKPFEVIADKPPTKDTKSDAPLSWSEVGLGAAKNLGPSALQFGKDLVHPIIHPIDTAESLKNLGLGLMEKLGPHIDPLDQESQGPEQPSAHEKYADAVGKFFADRYGGVENVKRTLATDPVGLAADLSMLLTGGGSAVARAPSYVGKLGEAAATAGRAIDPINAAVQATKLAGRGASELIGGLGTHTGGESLRIAAGAGYEGGEAAKAFRDNIRGVAPLEDTVEAARVGLDNMRKQRGSAYRTAMKEIGADKTVLDFDNVDRAFLKVSAVKNYKGESLSPSTSKVRHDIMETIDHWRGLDPAEFHTAEGLDALKQKIGDIVYGTTEAGTPARMVGDQIYKSIKKTISDQAPKYSKIMNAYETATNEIREIERTLSLPGDNRATIDASLRKLQSALRDNVNTSFGRRKELAQYLIDAGSPQLLERLAGQALKPGLPRGLGRLAMSATMEGLLLLAGAAHAGFSGGAAALAPAAAALPFMSPRLMGGAFYGAGRLASPAKYASPRPRTAYQLGRLTTVDDNDRQAGIRRALAATRESQ